MDAVQAANSGHPGMPMGMADAATVLWTRFLTFDPEHPDWPDRDRFVLSAGHGSMLLYALLHLSGYALSLDDLKAFRQWGSKTPGHPEVKHTPGVETTTGPLGQGFGNAVGMALAERYLRETFGRELCDHYTYGICSDGDLMEGVSNEAASLAGHWGLGRLILLYDDNGITIDGKTALAFSEDVGLRFEALGWHVRKVDGHDPEAVAAAIHAAREVADRPSLIACRTIIGKGSPSYEGTERTHGAALGADEVKKTKARLGLDPEASFVTPDDVVRAFRGAARPDRRKAWEARVAAHPEGERFRAWLNPDWTALCDAIQWPTYAPGKALATRKASLECLKAITAAAPFVIGGSADLAESNGTHLGKPILTRETFAGASGIAFGVREHGMGAICNGMALHGGLRPYGATFLMFHDYHRPSVRLSALMRVPTVWVYSHDSVHLGEDGPTHQPIATLLALRAIPDIEVWRPADANETALAWKEILLRSSGPSSILLTRQNVPHLDPGVAKGARRGGYVLNDPPGGAAEVVLMGTGSEVSLCLAAAAELERRGVKARVVSLPCRERFHRQDRSYRDAVLPPGVPRVAVEAAVSLGWERWVGEKGAIVGIDRFGASAPGDRVARELGLSPEHVADVAQEVLG
jgi:transketolase